MNKQKLATLEHVNLRDVWPREDKDFTPWLANEENIRLLLDEIGVFAEKDSIRTEDNAGRYYVDITAYEIDSGKKIIIENQLTVTDHSHLGQLLTYAANFEACILVWVVKEAREEHQKAIEWFNDHIDDGIDFFLVKTELYQIGDSDPAPKFTIIVQPNSWSKTIKGGDTTNPSDTKLSHLRFWEGFKDYASSSNTNLNIRQKPGPRAWYNIAIGNSNAHLSVGRNTQKNELFTGIYIKEPKKIHKKLFDNKDKFQEHVEDKIEWLELPEKKASRIQCSLSCDFSDNNNNEEYYKWILKTAGGFADAFREMVTED